MAKADLLKYANDKQPTDFADEFKKQLEKSVQKAITPEPEGDPDDGIEKDADGNPIVKGDAGDE